MMGGDRSSAGRVRLRRLEAGDLDAVHLLLSNWDVVRYMLLPLCSREESGKFLRDAMAEHASPAWRSVVRAVVDADSGRLIGLGGVPILLGAEQGELWYLLDPGCWGRGPGACFAGQLAALGFGELKIHGEWKDCFLYAMLSEEWESKERAAAP
jgi:RimJ/RimL family protein N-acetyltransferase